jgi:hypothetical protein
MNLDIKNDSFIFLDDSDKLTFTGHQNRLLSIGWGWIRKSQNKMDFWQGVLF